MRAWPVPRGGWLLSLALLACMSFAQDGAGGDEFAALRDGQLVVWVLQGGPPLNRATIVPAYRAPKPGLTTATTGELGQTSSTFGQTAGSYGVSSDSKTISAPPSGTGYAEQTSGDYGQTSGSFGHPASEHGQTPSTLGTTAGSVGTNASDAGQSVGDFGHSLSTIATAGTTDAQAMAAAAKRHAGQGSDGRSTKYTISDFPGLKARMLTVNVAQLPERLAEAQGTEDSPDVVMGYPVLPPEWKKQAQQFGLVTLGTPLVLPLELSTGQVVTVQRPVAEAAVLQSAPHPQAARAFVLWTLEGSFEGHVFRDRTAATLRAPVAAAVSAITGLVAGNSVGEADPAMAEFSAALARQTMLNAAVDGSLTVHVSATRSAGNDHFAVVALRVVASSDKAFGVVHPLLVLRRADDGRWLVLQLTTNLDAAQQGRAFDRLAPLVSGDAAAHLGEVSLDSPNDGDTRPLTPELGWENGGGATVIVVEWQYGQGGAWTDSHLYFVTDGTVRSQTRATAQFAAWPGSYRWRVWLVGKGGALKLSAWRKVNVVK